MWYEHVSAVGIDIYDALAADKQLSNAVTDARLVAEELKRAGYEVPENAINITRAQFYATWQSFLDRVEMGDTVVVFLSGHGVEIEGKNFVLPRDVPYIRFDRQKEIKYKSISITQLLLDLREREPQRIIVIVDACRDNPFVPAEYSCLGSGARGLAAMDPAAGEFIMYSAGAGETALDRLPGERPGQNLI